MIDILTLTFIRLQFTHPDGKDHTCLEAAEKKQEGDEHRGRGDKGSPVSIVLTLWIIQYTVARSLEAPTCAHESKDKKDKTCGCTIRGIFKSWTMTYTPRKAPDIPHSKLFKDLPSV